MIEANLDQFTQLEPETMEQIDGGSLMEILEEILSGARDFLLGAPRPS